MLKTVIVASHRRSGTHLAIDAITNNFGTFYNNRTQSFLNLDHLAAHIKQHTVKSGEVIARTRLPLVLLKRIRMERQRIFLSDPTS